MNVKLKSRVRHPRKKRSFLGLTNINHNSELAFSVSMSTGNFPGTERFIEELIQNGQEEKS